MEIWKDVIGYENLYQVSNLGRVKNKFGRILPQNSSGRYLRVCLNKNKVNKKIAVHRLVAKAFIPNPNNYETVNHIDENRFNNNIENLEWCTNVENSRKYYFKGEILDNNVIQKDINGNIVSIFPTAKSASKSTGISRTAISGCLNKHRKTAGGYCWTYGNVTCDLCDTKK